MCEDCWIEMGKPNKLPVRADFFARQVRRLYGMPRGGVGGNLHIVLDDWNLEDSSLDYCHGRTREALMQPGRTDAIIDYEQNVLELGLWVMLAGWTEAERGAAMALAENFIDEEGRERPPAPVAFSDPNTLYWNGPDGLIIKS